jgi:hypothetical protein
MLIPNTVEGEVEVLLLIQGYGVYNVSTTSGHVLVTWENMSISLENKPMRFVVAKGQKCHCVFCCDFLTMGTWSLKFLVI